MVNPLPAEALGVTLEEIAGAQPAEFKWVVQ